MVWVSKMEDKFAKWHGINRESIDWHPVIDEEKCVGCGMCVTTCGRGVYKYDFDKKKSKVENPYHCLVACQTCANLCPKGAISFVKEGNKTTREKAQKILRDTKVLVKVKKELEEMKVKK